MKRVTITFVTLFFNVFSGVGDSYMFVREGEIKSTQPRDLPSVGIRLDNGAVVLGLPGASQATQEACGWYRVQPWSGLLGPNQAAGKPSYSFQKGGIKEQREILTRVEVTPQMRIGQALAAMPGESDDERVTALIRAVAETVTNQLSAAITITVPAAKSPGGIGEAGK